MIVLGTGCGSLMQLMQEGKKRSGPANRTAPLKARSGPRPEAYLTICSSPERQTR